MLFNSFEFLIFLPIVFSIYWFVTKGIRAQNLLILISSYVFYGWWDWRFLGLIMLSTLSDYTIGIWLEKTSIHKNRKRLLYLSLGLNLGILGVFKYFNFFVENFQIAFSSIGIHFSPETISIILPVGISFYTFQTLSYSIDVYRKKLEPSKDLISFSAFVSFFPQLVAGPIERATNLLPQFKKERKFSPELASDGMRQILWGFFKKLVIADNCAIYANDIFSNSGDYSGSTLVLGALFFAFQIYGDFSGYSDIAIGVARLFGFNLMKNFAFPYFSRDIAEFWRRWHISLSTWFRDYLYIPLGGSRGSTAKKVRNTFIIFVISGFWHGANWTFIAWGAVNAIYFLPLLLAKRNRTYLDDVAQNRHLPSLHEIARMTINFLLVCLAWIFFRADNITHAFSYISEIFSATLFDKPLLNKIDINDSLNTILFILGFVLVEWFGRKGEYGIQNIKSLKSPYLRWFAYLIICLMILFAGNFSTTEFIYFAF